ncbi:uncharacterized protein [Palaemon carinicauda]|uniref:uncharacterized protein n=1 Tax=Palaemon carinicauda TaxID=392227 RepID=UPI0035B595B4
MAADNSEESHIGSPKVHPLSIGHKDATSSSLIHQPLLNIFFLLHHLLFLNSSTFSLTYSFYFIILFPNLLLNSSTSSLTYSSYFINLLFLNSPTSLNIFFLLHQPPLPYSSTFSLTILSYSSTSSSTFTFSYILFYFIILFPNLLLLNSSTSSLTYSSSDFINLLFLNSSTFSLTYSSYFITSSSLIILPYSNLFYFIILFPNLLLLFNQPPLTLPP